MPGTLLRQDYEQANQDELRAHLQDLLNPPTPSDSLTNPTIQVAPPPTPAPVIQEPPTPAPAAQDTRDELQSHLDSLMAPDTSAAPAGAPSDTAAPPRPLQLLGEGLTSLGAGAQNAREELTNHLTSLLAPVPEPAAATPQAALGQGAPTPSDTLTNPVGTGNTVVGGGPLQDYARQAAQKAGIDPDIFVRQIQQESGFDPNAKSPAGATGVAQFMPQTAAGMGVDPNDPYASLDGAARLMASNLKKYGGDYAKALAAYNAGPGNVDQYGGVPPFEETKRYVANILGSAKDAVTSAVQGAGQAVQQKVTDLSQFGDSQLTAAEANAACGPAAAVRFAQRFGRNPTLREATDLAQTVGWTSGSGMAGLGSEKALMDKMGVATKLVSGPDWGTFADEARTGNPVTISTQGHYFTADGWDPQTNRFHVGRSGMDLKGGSEWMTPEQMTSVMGPVQGGLLADNPTTPASTAATIPDKQGQAPGFIAPSSSTDQQMAQVEAPKPLQLIGEGFSTLGSAAQANAQGGLKVIDDAINTATRPGATPAQAQPIPSDVLSNPLGTGNTPQASAQLTGQPAGGIAESQPLNPVARGVTEAVAGVQSPQTGNPLIDVPGAGASALGTLAQNATTGLRNITPTSELTRGALGMEQLVNENRDLFDQQQRLSDQYLQAQRNGDTGRMEEIAQQMDALQAQLPDARNRDVLHAAADRNPSTPLVETGANLAGAAAAAPLAAEGAPLAARALASAIDPGTGLPSLIVRGLEELRPGATRILTDAAAAQEAAGQVQKMPGTAELAPVREVVPQTQSDLLQAMLDQARSRGVDPEKIATLQQQINALDPEAATRRVLGGAQQAQISLRGAATLGGAAAGGAAGNASTPEDALTLPSPVGDIPIERIARTAAGAGLGAGLGATLAGGGQLDYEGLAALRTRTRQPPMPGMPTPPVNPADKVIAFTVNNMLSNPASLLVNALGGGMETVKRPVVTAFSGELGPAGADLRAMGHAIGDALADSAETLASGRRAMNVIDQPEAFPGRSGMVATPFLRIMGATDEFVRTLNSAGAQGAELARLMRRNPTLSQTEILDRYGQQIMSAGTRAAAEATYSEGGTGLGRAIAGTRRELTASDASVGQRLGGAATQVLVPFSVVPDVILSRGVSRLPGINELITTPIQVGRGVAAGDMVAARRAAASGALGTLTNTAILAQVNQGNITGNGPDDPAKKRALMQARDDNGDPVWRPNSIRAGGQWVPYSSFGPVAVQLGAVANAVEQYNDAGKQVNPNVARAFGSALGDTIMDAWYLQTLSGVFSAIKNGTIPEWLGGQALSTAGRAIPEAGLANMLRGLTDPVVREPKPKVEDPSSWLDYFANRVPGVSETVQPRLDPATGRPIEEPRSPASVLVRGTAPGEPNPVNDILARHNLGVGDAPGTISPVSGVTVAITEDEKRRFLELSGPEVEKRVLAMQNNPSFKKAPPDVQRDLLQEVIQDGRDAGAAKLFQSLGREEQVRRMLAYDAAQKRQAEPSVRLP